MEAVQPLKDALEQLQARLSAVESKVGICSSSASSGASASASASASTSTRATAPQELSPQMIAYDAYVKEYLPPFVAAATKLGDDTRKLAEITQRAFDAQRAYLLRASQCKKPSSPHPEHLQDLTQCIKEINGLRDNRSDFAHHQNMVNEGIQALGWLCVEPAPKPFIESYIGGSDFWGNKIRVQFKSSNPDQIAFVTSFKALLTELMAYVKAEHTTGVTWNPKGGDASAYVASAAAPQASGGLFDSIRAVSTQSAASDSLRKVTKDMQTWRPEFKEGGGSAPAAPVASKAVPKAKAKAPAAAVAVAATKKTPVCELRRDKWHIEYQTEGAPITVPDLNIKQQVYIYNCTNATIILEGKVKSIILDACKKTKVLFDSAVSSLEVVNCRGIQVQCKDRVPSVAIDKTDGCLIYLSWEGRETQIVTSKSSEMNVAFPAGPGSDDIIERPIPEQFVHTITSDLTISSGVSDLYSH